jgi:hypothetical protein
VLLLDWFGIGVVLEPVYRALPVNGVAREHRSDLVQDVGSSGSTSGQAVVVVFLLLEALPALDAFAGSGRNRRI